MTDEEFVKQILHRHNEKSLNIVTIFNKPIDYPNKFVARLFLNQQPTKIFIVKDHINDIYNLIPEHYTFINRYVSDIPAIVGTFIY